MKQGQRQGMDGEKIIPLKGNIPRLSPGAVRARMGSITHASHVAVAKEVIRYG